VSETFHRILDATGYVAELKAENSDDAKARIQNLEEFDTVIQFFEEECKERGMGPGHAMLPGLSQPGHARGVAPGEDRRNRYHRRGFSMMTLHSSKGLEFPLVFLVGLEEGIFPFAWRDRRGAPSTRESIEEERRLCYVGMTRAKEKLVMTNAAMRRIYGQVQVSPASRFLHEVPTELVDAEVVRAEGSSGYGVARRSGEEREGPWVSLVPEEKSSSSSSPSGGRTYEYDLEDSAPTYQVQAASSQDGKQIKVGPRKVRPWHLRSRHGEAAGRLGVRPQGDDRVFRAVC